MSISERRGIRNRWKRLELFDEYQGVVEEVMEETVDLTQIDEHALSLWSDDRKRKVHRYLTDRQSQKTT